MAINSYSTLVNAVGNWLNRTDLSGVAPDFIALTEARLNRELRVRPMECRAVATTTADDPNIALPVDYLDMRMLRVNTSPKRALQYMSPTHFTQTYGGNTTGSPEMFTIADDQIVMGPTPDAEYQLELYYWQKLSGLTSSNATNWLISGSPDVYLYGVLKEACDYIHDKEAAAYWDQKFAQAIAAVRESYDTEGSTSLQMRHDVGTT